MTVSEYDDGPRLGVSAWTALAVDTGRLVFWFQLSSQNPYHQLTHIVSPMGDGSSEAGILLIEDNRGDIRLLEEAFSDGNVANTLHTVTDGQAALDFIYRRGEYEDAPRPDVVLLDLHLPKVDGEDVLHEIKHHPELSHVPVIVLTGLDEDLIESRDLDDEADEDAVLEKPIDLGEFVEVIGSFEQFRLAVMRTD